MRLLQRRPGGAPEGSAPAGSGASAPTAEAAQPPVAELEETYAQVGMRPPPLSNSLQRGPETQSATGEQSNGHETIAAEQEGDAVLKEAEDGAAV
eukprot:5202916-Alexandrium_andersonii.AAC.1